MFKWYYRLKTKQQLYNTNPINQNPIVGNDLVENIYNSIVRLLKRTISYSTPYFRRALRFVALPYCYFNMVNWAECTVSRFQVIKDFLYIFFRLKYFPDNYSCCRLWEQSRDEWIYYYGSNYDPYQRGRLRREVQKAEYEILFEDKEVCYQLCQCADINVPKCFGIIDPYEDYRFKLRSIFIDWDLQKIIIKPVRGSAGQGIVLAFKNSKQSITIKSRALEIDLDDFELKERSIIQEVLTQDDVISKISSSSINTVRVLTLYTISHEVIILSSSMRFGVGDSYIDNWSAGGVAVGVDHKTGNLKKIAYDKHGNQYMKHPDSEEVFEGCQIPRWNEVIKLATTVQERFTYYKLLGMDIAVSKEKPIIIEINAFPDFVFQEQTSGPFLKDSRILTEFEKYNLLINKFQRKLCKN